MPAGASWDTPRLSVIVPTRNEAGNVAVLVERLHAALRATDVEILFVDDSTDETPDRIRAVAERTDRPVRLLHRAEADRVGGLGGAVLLGLRAARGEWAVVMDGDLQHPPESVPELVQAGVEHDADLVVASRYCGSGSAAGLSGAARRRVSGAGTHVTRAVFPRRLAGCSDPMSGFFAVRRGAVDLDRLRPRGFKILLEIVARAPRLRVAEVPFVFQERHSGDSKASLREGLLLARKLVALRVASLLAGGGPVPARALGFAAVGATGIVVNSLALWLLVDGAGAGVLVAAALATQVSTVWNYLLTEALVFRGPKARSRRVRFLGFLAVNNAVLVLRLPLLAWLVRSAGMNYVAASVLTLVAAFAARFLVSDRILFRVGVPMPRDLDDVAADPAIRSVPQLAPDGADHPVELVVDLRELAVLPRQRSSEDVLPYRYDIHGLVSLSSAVPLKELAGFAVAPVANHADHADIEIRRGAVGRGGLRRRTRVTQYASPAAVSYEEHLGRLGSDFSVRMGSPIEVVVGPLLVRSPHVLYTNIVEALLRFVLVSRGHILLHSACLELDGRGVLLSALTDTGKTGTILRLVRENQSKFLSDDMTVLRPDGTALSFPKPLTISQHTLRAVQAGDLTPKEWRRLRIQSRLHSREGRGIGVRLGELNVPIMSLNAVTQLLVPPPKFDIGRLVPCEHASAVQVEELFIIERRPFALTGIDPELLVDELIANTDDAYGFPPFRYFAPALVVEGLGYEELRAAERAILASGLADVRARRLATPDFTWADLIPQLAAAKHDAALPADGSSPPSAPAGDGRGTKPFAVPPLSAAAGHGD
jgi:glycosyltransferase involved in cell wall biosynthesis